MRIIRRVALGLLLVVGTAIGLALLGIVIPQPFVATEDRAALDRRILVVSNPIHTDIAIPIDDVTLASFGFLAETGLPVLHPDARWLLIGWGGRSFYLETPTFADIKPGPTFRALTIDSSVMHVDVLAEIPLSDPAVMALDISTEAYRHLLTEASNSFSRVDGRVQPIEGYALGANDRFYEAEGSFNALTASLALFNSLPAAPP